MLTAAEYNEAYSDGINAAWRIDDYEGVEDVPECPYKDTERADAWDLGFADGTDDLINSKRS